MNIPAYIGERISLAPLTTFKVGGAARYLARPANESEVEETLAFAKKHSLPVLVLGGGSNLLVADKGVEALVVSLSAKEEFGVIEEEGDAVWRVGAAVPLAALVAATVRLGRAGLAMMSGIPGRVGGAVAMNAGGTEAGMGDFVREALVYTLEGERRVYGPSELEFSYRHSNIAGMLALSFVMHFPDAEKPDQLENSAREFRERKKASQPLAVPSAGCVFKNPPNDSAGSLLDVSGCKGMAEGGARVSELHANFIVVDGPATSAGVARLAARMRRKVLDETGIRLEPEVLFWGEDPSFDALRG